MTKRTVHWDQYNKLRMGSICDNICAFGCVCMCYVFIYNANTLLWSSGKRRQQTCRSQCWIYIINGILFFVIFFSICLFKIVYHRFLKFETFNLEFRKPSYVDEGSFVSHCVSSIFIVLTRFHSSNVYLSLLGCVPYTYTYPYYVIYINFFCFYWPDRKLCSQPQPYLTIIFGCCIMVSRYL